MFSGKKNSVRDSKEITPATQSFETINIQQREHRQNTHINLAPGDMNVNNSALLD
jgi:hypothetical protein